MDRLPRLPNGKVDRKGLPSSDANHSASVGESVAPRTAAEAVLARIAADVLGRERVGVHDDLIDLGLDSILGIQVATRAREAGLALRPAQLFQHTTIAELAENAGSDSDVHSVRPDAVSGEFKKRRERVSAVAIASERAAHLSGQRMSHSLVERSVPPMDRGFSPLQGVRTPVAIRESRELPGAGLFRPFQGQHQNGRHQGARTTALAPGPNGPAAPAKARLAPTVIESFGVYLPPKVVSTAEVVRGCRLPLDFPLERMTGIRSRRMAGETEFAVDLAEKAVIDCLARSAYEPGDIDLLICCNISRCDRPGMQFSYEPTTAARLQRRFGFEHATAFDISNACAGTFTAIAVADAFLKTGAAQCA